MQPTFEVGEADGDGLDALLVRQVAHPRLADIVGTRPRLSVGLGRQVQLLQLVVGDLQKLTQTTAHANSLPLLLHAHYTSSNTTAARFWRLADGGVPFMLPIVRDAVRTWYVQGSAIPLFELCDPHNGRSRTARPQGCLADLLWSSWIASDRRDEQCVTQSRLSEPGTTR
jgi:hypothetical protein